MRKSLQERCDLLVANEEKVRKAVKLEFGEMHKLAALVYTSQGKDTEQQSLAGSW